MRRFLVTVAIALAITLGSGVLVFMGLISWTIPIAAGLAAFVVGGFVTRRRGRAGTAQE